MGFLKLSIQEHTPHNEECLSNPTEVFDTILDDKEILKEQYP